MDPRKDRLLELLLVHSFRFRPEEPFTLASGRTSPYYLDCKPVTLHPEGLNLVGALGYEIAKRVGVEAIGGLTLGADPIACAIAMHSFHRSRHLQAFVVRKEIKAHGTGRQVEGGLEPGTKVAVVDDVITTGGSTVLAIERARAAGLVVEHVIVLCDREEGGREHIEAHGVEVHALLTRGELMLRRDVAHAHAVQEGLPPVA